MSTEQKLESSIEKSGLAVVTQMLREPAYRQASWLIKYLEKLK